MVELILVRHAKSDWADASLRDHDRPLSAQGLQNAPMMAKRLAETGVKVDHLVSSTALRAHSTAKEFGEALDIDVDLASSLYMSSAETLFATAVAAGGSTVLAVAHDPGMTALAFRLSDGEIPHMPTCAVARFTWNGDWDDAATRPADSWSFDSPQHSNAHDETPN